VALDLPQIPDLDPSRVAAVQALIADRVAAAAPRIDARRGVYHDRVLHLAAAAAGLMEGAVDRLIARASLLDVASDPTLADGPAVDRLLSNFRAARRPATAAAGEVVFVVSARAPLVLPAGTRLSSGAATFRTTSVVSVRTSPDQVASETDRALAPLPGGGWAFKAPAAADLPGPAGALRRGDVLTPSQPPPFFVKAYVADDWSGGAAAQSGAELAAEAAAGLAAKCWGSRASTEALVRSRPEFAAVSAVSIVGAGDPEMLRAARGVFPAPAAGRCDLYFRVAGPPARAAVRREAVLVAAGPDGSGEWLAQLGPDDAPGCYGAAAVVPAGGDPASDRLPVVASGRSLDPAAGAPGPAPDVRSAAEAAFSRYQTLWVRFRDPGTPTVGLAVGSSRREYDVVCAGQPLVAELQAFLGSRRHGPPDGDLLVRAAVPCTVAIDLEVLAPPGAAVDRGAAAAAAAAAVNRGGFPGRLDASALAAAVAPLLPAGAAVGAVALRGEVLRPDGTVRRVRGRASIAIPDEPASGSTPRNTAFLLDPADVAVRVVAAPAPEA